MTVRDRYVYVITDIGGTPFYVGVGKGDRMHHHVRKAEYLHRRYPHNAKDAFIADCLSRGFVPEPVKVAENLTIEEAMEHEASLIARCGRRDIGTGCLLNATSGGYGIRNQSKNAKLLIAEKLRGRKRPNELVDKIAERTREALKSPIIRQKMSEKAKQRWASPAQRERQAVITKRQFATKEAREAHAALTRQQFSSDAARSAHAEKTKTQWASVEGRQRIMDGRREAAIKRNHQ